jgi:hypothetical protein
VSDSLTRAVLAEFSAASFPREHESLAVASRRAAFLGNRELSRLRLRLASLHQSSAGETITALATGSVLAEFVTAAVPLEEQQKETVSRLGALLILMIAMFDAALDRGAAVPRLFTPDEEVPASDGSPLALVIRHYFAELRSLPADKVGLIAMLWKALHRLYFAEMASVSYPAVSRSVWWRKNALPFVVMGLPAWILSAGWEQPRFRCHLLWLGRLGEFFGWLDDVIDREFDARFGHANRTGVLLGRVGEAQFARRLAGMGDRVLSDWDRWTRSPPARDVFAMMVWTWIENSPLMHR